MSKPAKQKNFVSYIRVSTKRQGQSGLGLDAQRQTVADYAQREGAVVLQEYVEVESGKNSDRARLAEALEHCRAARATLVVAKLDRLSRNVAFLSRLMDSQQEFIAIDNPHANRLTVHILAAVAEQEARSTSERTVLALAQAKKRGVLLGSSRPGHWAGRESRRLLGSKRGVARAAVVRHLSAKRHNGMAVAEANKLRQAGKSWQSIADALNEKGLVTSRGNAWCKSSVYTAAQSAAGAVLLLAGATAQVLSDLGSTALEAALS